MKLKTLIPSRDIKKNSKIWGNYDGAHKIDENTKMQATMTKNALVSALSEKLFCSFRTPFDGLENLLKIT